LTKKKEIKQAHPQKDFKTTSFDNAFLNLYKQFFETLQFYKVTQQHAKAVVGYTILIL